MDLSVHYVELQLSCKEKNIKRLQQNIVQKERLVLMAVDNGLMWGVKVEGCIVAGGTCSSLCLFWVSLLGPEERVDWGDQQSAKEASSVSSPLASLPCQIPVAKKGDGRV